MIINDINHYFHSFPAGPSCLFRYIVSVAPIVRRVNPNAKPRRIDAVFFKQLHAVAAVAVAVAESDAFGFLFRQPTEIGTRDELCLNVWCRQTQKQAEGYQSFHRFSVCLTVLKSLFLSHSRTGSSYDFNSE